MASCINCGREISAGAPCPYCGAPNSHVPSAGSGLPADTGRFEISITHVVVGINVLVFLAMVFTGVSLFTPTEVQLKHWGANWGPLSLGSQPWRILTSNYVHIGIIHLAFNMWCLWNLGQLAERILGRLNFFILYTICGLAGSIASLWWHPMVVGAGASGAIFGLAGASIAIFYLGHLPIPRAAIQSTTRSLVTFVGYNLLFGLAPGIDNSAHIGGLVAGLAMGAALAHHVLVPVNVRRTWTGLTWITMAAVLFVSYGTVRRHYPQIARLADPQVIASQQIAIAMSALGQNKPEQAVDALKDAIDAAPSAAEPNYLLGVAYLMQRKPDLAIPAFQRALKLNPQYAEAAAGLGTAYLAKGMKAEAEKAFQLAAKLGYYE